MINFSINDQLYIYQNRRIDALLFYFLINQISKKYAF